MEGGTCGEIWQVLVPSAIALLCLSGIAMRHPDASTALRIVGAILAIVAAVLPLAC